MADFFAGGVQAGKTSRSVWFILRSNIDATEVIGKVAADMTASYWRQGGTRTAITLSDLAAVNSAYSAGGVKEVDATNEPGLYRLDLPDAAIATGADWVLVSVKVANAYVVHMPLPLDVVTGTLGTILTAVNAIKAITDTIVVSSGKVAAAITAAGDFAQAAADKVWTSATRTLSSFGFTVSLAQSVWDETAASHNTAGTTGAQLNASASAGDPWTTALPGSYGAGTAGAILSGLGGDSADIDAIKAKTDQLTFTTPNVVDATATGGMTETSIAAAVHSTVLTESYAADGAEATLGQLLYMLWAAAAAEKVVSGTTVTVKKLNGTDTAMTFTLNDATNPTSITRSG